MKQINQKMIVAIPLLLLFLVFLTITPVSADIKITAMKHTGITIDGLIGDWAGIPGTKITMVRPYATSDRIIDGLEVRTAYDDSNIYVLILVTDDYDYNITDNHKSAAIAVLFPIDEAATPDMGGGKGNVDIWHWELDVGPGVVTGFNLVSGNDPVGNLDDEYSFSITDRHDDDTANEVYGAWSHTNMSAVGAKGVWIFEFKRSLITSDALKQDVHFEIGKTFKMAVAYWDADEKGEPGVKNGWTAAGHYSTCTDPDTLDFSWIDMDLKQVEITQGTQGLQGPLGPQGPPGPQGPAGTSDWITYVSLGTLVLAIIAIAIGIIKKP